MEMNCIVIIRLILFLILILFNTGVSFAQESLPSQSGLKVKTIYIDPSYGGKERGPRLANKQYSSEVTLLIALELKDLLAHQGFSVYLSRDSNQFVDLDTRVSLARSRGADAYIRIKISERREDCIRLFIATLPKERETEQNTDTKTKTLSGLDSELNRILSSLLAFDKHEYSLTLAGTLKNSLEDSQIVDCINIQKVFDYILLNTAMPAVTVYLGFSRQPKPASYILGVEEQKRIARAIAVAVKRYADERP